MSRQLHLPGALGKYPRTQQVPVTHTEPVLGADGMLYELRVEGTAEVNRGPLGRFLDLAQEMEDEGLTVPSEIRDVLDRLNER